MTKLLVLGLLDEKPMSGYDIQQKISDADAQRWGGVLVGSIYHALKKLEQDQYIEIADMEQRGHRQKAVYRITARGRIYLHALIQESLSSSSVAYPTTLYSGLSLIGKLSKEDSLCALKEQKELLNEEYCTLVRGQNKNENSGDEIPIISQLTIENMFEIVRLQQKFIDKLIHALEEDD